MVDLETIIALAIMTYIDKSNFMSYIREMKKISTTLLMKAMIFCYTYYRDELLVKSIFIYLC